MGGAIVRSLKEMNSVAGDRTKNRPRTTFWITLIVLLGLSSTVLKIGAADEKRIAIYSVAANYFLPVQQYSGKDYVGLLEILEPLGSVNAKTNGNHWKLLYEDAPCEFTSRKKKARIRGKDFDLAANFLLQDGRGIVPLSGLSTLLQRILGGPVTFNEAARRLFIGNVAVHFTAEVSKTTPPKLVIHFASPVNPMIATEPGKLRMEFTREPVVAPGSQVLTFDSDVIPSASFQETNGTAELVVNSKIPLMATFSNQGRTITVAPPATHVAATETKAPPLAAPSTSPALPVPTAVATPPAVIHYFAVVDASHGGDERGAALTDQLAEKDVTLALARSLRQELTARGLTTMMVRDADVTLTADQRASLANSEAASIYICIHASSDGHGVRLYTALLPPGGDNRGLFVDWNTAQSPFLQASQAAEQGLAEGLKAKGIPVRSLSAPLRPLNHVAAAAVAIEVAPPGDDVSQLGSPSYQELVAGAVATGVVDVRDRLKAAQK